MAVGFSNTNKPINPRGNDASPKAFNRAKLYSGKALDFDGVNDYVDCGTLDVTAYTAISMSFNFQLANITDNGLRLVSLLHSGTDDIRIEQGLSVLRIALDDGTAYTLETPSLTANEWNKFDMTFNGSTLEGYINGVSIGSMSASFNFSTANGLLNLFKHTAASSYAEGLMAGFKLFNTALTAAQVADLYNNPEKVVPTGVANTALKLWLPMQEGAGTTAYDGSGNGNHGTISGATYTHGIGAPVSQTAVIDWNKAKNDIGRSQEFDNAYWSTGNITVTANDTTAPDGTTTADKLVATSTSSSNAEIFRAIGFGANDSASVFVKSDTAQWVTLGTNRTYGRVVWFDIINGIVGTESTGYTGVITEYPNGWYKLDASWDGTATTQTYWDLSIGNADNSVGVTAGKSVFAWGAYANLSGTTIGPYIATLTDSAITSPVLLPQGLTTGRDITGVNLFENVRKQGALNLDGNSWAEVHDNESIDLSDANASFEAWVYHIDKGVVSQYIMNKFDGTTGVRVRTETGNNFGFYASDGTNNIADSGAFALTENAWNHIVLTTDGTNFKRYINGALVDTDVAGTALTTFANADSLYIGSEQTNTSLTESRIAQPRIYNRALTAAEVLQNYNSGKNTYK